MTIHRFYTPDLTSGQILLNKEDSAHARKSLRLVAGDVIALFNGNGTIAKGLIEHVGPQLTVQVDQCEHVEPPKPIITIACAVPKGARAEVMVEKLSELGCDRWIPLITHRSVVNPRAGKMDRFRRVVVEASKQCGRAYLMTIDPPTELTKLLKSNNDPMKLIADIPDAVDVQNMQDNQGPVVTVSTIKSATGVLILIGPEGGWTNDERKAAGKAGFKSWTFAPNVLRIETATMAAMAILRT